MRMFNARATVPRLSLFIFLGAMLAAGAPAHAGLIGDTITCTPSFPLGTLTLAPTAVIIDPGIEFTLAQPSTALFDFDFNGNFLTIRAVAGFNNIGQPTSFTFGDLDWIGDPPTYITGLALDPGATIITQASLSFTNDSLTVNICCGNWYLGNSATIQILTNQEPVTADSHTWGAVKALYQ